MMRVGRADDRAELEADAAATAAMSRLGRSGSVREGGAGGLDDVLGGLRLDTGLERRINRARRGGQALDGTLQRSMEGAFGDDFSDVRIHTGREADALNTSLQAKAFTTGRDIFVRSDAYSPRTGAGSRLMAHELAHVQQQSSGVQRAAVVQRSFDPKNPNLESVTAIKKLKGGNANKGVYFLTGEGGNQLVAKFIDDEARRAQFNDSMFDQLGVNNPGSQPYGMDLGNQIVALIRRFADDARQQGDEATAQSLESGANASQGARGVVLMRRMGGEDLGDVLTGFGKGAKPQEREQAQRSGIDPTKLILDPKFHYNLGRMYVADGLMASADRLYHNTDRGAFNTKNIKVLTDGTINTFDSDTAMVAWEIFRKSEVEDKSKENWAKWLLEGGLVWKVGVETPAGMVQNLTTMFDTHIRQELYDAIVQKFTLLADDLDWSTFEKDFYAFDTWFMRGIVDEIEKLVVEIDHMVEEARKLEQGDRGKSGIDSQALKLRAGYMKDMLPDLRGGGMITDNTKKLARETFFAEAGKLVSKNKVRDTAHDLTEFDPQLLPVPQRQGKLSTATKIGRKIGRGLRGLGANTTKIDKSAAAKRGRKKAQTRDLEGTKEILTALKEMSGEKSHRRQRAEFDVGLQHAILAMHRRAVEFSNADGDIMKLDAQIGDKDVVAEHLAPYREITRSQGYARTMQQFKDLAKGYRDQLDRKKDGAQVKELDDAERELTERHDGFDAGIFYIERQLQRSGSNGR